MVKTAIPRTRQQKGRMWATVTLAICGTFSVYANVRSGALYRDSIVVSALPPVVAFLSSHLISYFSPRTKWMKTVIYGGFGLICTVAMYGSGWHIVDFVSRNGQHWTTAVSYVFITDAPMLLAAGILIEKVTTARITAKQTTPAKRTSPAKTTVTAKSTKPTTTRRATKTTKPAIVPIFTGPSIVDETAEVA